MITLDSNIILLCSMFNISYRKLANEYTGMSVEQIMQAEAQQGNTAAANFDQSVLGDPQKLIELFKLDDIGNKYAILSNMNEHDLENLLPFLEQQDLMAGLQFFTKDKLVDLSKNLPQKDLVKYVFNMFSPEQIMQLMPDEEIDKALTSEQLDKNFILKYLPSLKSEILAQMYETATGDTSNAPTMGIDGVQTDLTSQEFTNKLSLLPDAKFKEALLSMPPQTKKNFTLMLSRENPNIFLLFNPQAYAHIIDNRKNKEEMIKASNAIDNEQLVKMLKELPQDLTAIVLTQIDTKKFADVLLTQFKSILAEVIAG